MSEHSDLMRELKSPIPDLVERYERATGKSAERAGCSRRMIKLPEEFAYMTNIVDDQPIVQITIPITKAQFDALGEGKDIWEVL